MWLSITTVTFAPWWVVVLLLLLLVPQAVLVARWSADHPRRCVAVPVVGLVIWVGVSLLAG